MKIDSYLKKPYARKLIPDEVGYVASIQEFEGCIAEGDSAEDALSNLEVAAKSWIEAALDLGQAIPEPMFYQRYSGKIALRISKRLHKQAAEAAFDEGVSLNQLISNFIAEGLGERKARPNLHSVFWKNITANVMQKYLVRDSWEKLESGSCWIQAKPVSAPRLEFQPLNAQEVLEV